MKLIAASHVGCNGDALYALPTIRSLCERHGCKADFYTTPACSPIKSLMEAQSCINEFFVTKEFTNETNSIGPWNVGFPGIKTENYEAVYELSYKRFPDRPLPEFIAKEAGVEKVGPVRYDIPELTKMKPGSPYLVLAPRMDKNLGFGELFNKIAGETNLPVVVVGKPGEMVDSIGALDYTHLSFLEMAFIISKAKGFIGLLSAPLVVAMGFDIPKAVVFDGHSWDPRHVIRDRWTKYLVNPSVSEVLEVFKD